MADLDAEGCMICGHTTVTLGGETFCLSRNVPPRAVAVIEAAREINARLKPGVQPPNWQQQRELADALAQYDKEPLPEIEEPETPSGGPA